MTPLFKKLHYKGQAEIVILNAPSSFEGELIPMEKVALIKREIPSNSRIQFSLCFVLSEEEIDRYAKEVDTSTVEDGLIWFAYPKKSSKKYSTKINRDNGWKALGSLGYEAVGIASIDGDWSAVRFRKAKNIKKITRDKSWIMSKEGKEKASKL